MESEHRNTGPSKKKPSVDLLEGGGHLNDKNIIKISRL